LEQRASRSAERAPKKSNSRPIKPQPRSINAPARLRPNPVFNRLSSRRPISAPHIVFIRDEKKIQKIAVRKVAPPRANLNIRSDRVAKLVSWQKQNCQAASQTQKVDIAILSTSSAVSVWEDEKVPLEIEDKQQVFEENVEAANEEPDVSQEVVTREENQEETSNLAQIEKTPVKLGEPDHPVEPPKEQRSRFAGRTPSFKPTVIVTKTEGSSIQQPAVEKTKIEKPDAQSIAVENLKTKNCGGIIYHCAPIQWDHKMVLVQSWSADLRRSAGIAAVLRKRYHDIAINPPLVGTSIEVNTVVGVKDQILITKVRSDEWQSDMKHVVSALEDCFNQLKLR